MSSFHRPDSSDDPDVRDMFIEAKIGDARMLRARFRDTPEHVHACGRDRLTLLHQAAIYGRLNVVRLLVEVKADLDAQDHVGRTPLYLAIQSGAFGICQHLIASGAKVALATHGGLTPLHKAAIEGQTEIAELLIKAGAVVNQLADGYAGAPLHCVSRHPNDLLPQSDRIGVLMLLIRQHGVVDLLSKLGRTPLHTACERGDEGVVQALLQHGANANAMDSDDLTPLHLCCTSGWVSIARLLIGRDASVNARDRFGETPLHRAAGCGYATIVRMLRSAGADLGLLNMAGQSPRAVLEARLTEDDPFADQKYGYRSRQTLARASVRATMRALQG